MGEEVGDECLAALRAASEVIGEKCKLIGRPPIGRRGRPRIEEKRSPCWFVIGTITGVITWNILEPLLHIEVEESDFEVKEKREENKGFTCRGTMKFFARPRDKASSKEELEMEGKHLKRAVEATKEKLMKGINEDVLIVEEGLKITDFKIGDIKFERFEETGYEKGDILVDLEATVIKG